MSTRIHIMLKSSMVSIVSTCNPWSIPRGLRVVEHPMNKGASPSWTAASVDGKEPSSRPEIPMRVYWVKDLGFGV